MMHDETLECITAPYGFVPVSEHVVFPDWAAFPAWDLPFEDGVSGTVQLEIEALSPIFVRGAEEGSRFFTTPDGQFAIPGSSVRGLLRNLIEIVSFGKLSRVNDHRYGVRDLHNRDLYGQHMAEIRHQHPIPLVNAGWLRRCAELDDAPEHSDAVVAQIEPVDFAKLEYGLLLDHAERVGVRRFDPGRRQASPDKYAAWKASRTLAVEVEELRPAEGTKLITSFGKVTELGGSRQGTLVFTGQPNTWRRGAGKGRKGRGGGHPKHHDFVFLESSEPRTQIPVTNRAFRDFEFVHKAGSEQHRLTAGVTPNEEWGFWKSKFLNDEEAVPVFFLLEPSGRLRAFGLAMMFRLAYRWTTRDAVRNAQPLMEDERLDFAENLFGTVRTSRSEAAETVARRGRVSFGLASASSKLHALPERRELLAAPKASYYPSYLEQGEGPGEMPAQQKKSHAWQTYMDQGVRARGWKRYRPQAVRKSHTPTKADGRPLDDASKVMTAFRPLDRGARFRGAMRFHNLKRIELGALFWALDFGGHDDCWHLLGMARSLGYGRVQLRCLEASCLDPLDQPVDLDACRGEFTRYMEERCTELGVPGGWRGSSQIQELLALAAALPEGSSQGRHLLVQGGIGGNEFALAKKRGLALPMASVVPQQRAAKSPKTLQEQRAREAEIARAQAAREREERAAAEAAQEERKRRTALGPAGRLRERLAASGVSGEDADGQAVWLLSSARPVPAEEGREVAAYKTALRAEARPGIAALRDCIEIKEQGMRDAESRMAACQNQKPAKKAKKRFKSWTKERDKLNKQLEAARVFDQARVDAAREFLAWLDSPEAT